MASPSIEWYLEIIPDFDKAPGAKGALPLDGLFGLAAGKGGARPSAGLRGPSTTSLNTRTLSGLLRPTSTLLSKNNPPLAGLGLG